MGQNSKPTPSSLEVEGNFLTKPVDIANHFNNYLIGKVNHLRHNMPKIDNEI